MVHISLYWYINTWYAGGVYWGFGKKEKEREVEGAISKQGRKEEGRKREEVVKEEGRRRKKKKDDEEKKNSRSVLGKLQH